MIAMMRVSSFGVMVMVNTIQIFVSATRECHLKVNTLNGTLVQ
jgi:hypothetical protein